MDALLTNTAAALVFTWIVARAAEGFSGPTGAVLELQPIVYLGKISYGIYIFHLFVPYVAFKMFNKAGVGSGYFNLPLGFKALFWSAATILLASISWHLFERPINDLKRKWPYARTGERSRCR